MEGKIIPAILPHPAARHSKFDDGSTLGRQIGLIAHVNWILLLSLRRAISLSEL